MEHVEKHVEKTTINGGLVRWENYRTTAGGIVQQAVFDNYSDMFAFSVYSSGFTTACASSFYLWLRSGIV